MKTLLRSLSRRLFPLTEEEVVRFAVEEAARLKADLIDLKLAHPHHSFDAIVKFDSSWRSLAASADFPAKVRIELMVYNPESSESLKITTSGESTNLNAAMTKLVDELVMKNPLGLPPLPAEPAPSTSTIEEDFPI